MCPGANLPRGSVLTSTRHRVDRKSFLCIADPLDCPVLAHRLPAEELPYRRDNATFFLGGGELRSFKLVSVQSLLEYGQRLKWHTLEVCAVASGALSFAGLSFAAEVQFSATTADESGSRKENTTPWKEVGARPSKLQGGEVVVTRVRKG